MAEAKAYVAYYYAVSEQKRNGALDVEAQRMMVRSHIEGRGKLVGEFIDHENYSLVRRGALERAIEKTIRMKATLVITSIDHILINGILFPWLLKSGANFEIIGGSTPGSRGTCSADRLVRQGDSTISERINNALRARIRGRRLEKAAKETVRLMAADLHSKGWSLRAIADELNRQQIPTVRGRQWHASSVRDILVQRA